jgi:hypothetical protein
MRSVFISFASLLLSMPVTGMAASAADDDSIFDERFAIMLGTYYLSSDTRLRVDSPNTSNPGTEFNAEDDFNFDDETVFRLEGLWRFADRHKLRLMYFESSRSETRSRGRELRFGEVVFPVNLEVTAEFDFRIIELAYEYSFLRRENIELGGSIGIHNVTFEMGLSGTLTAPVGSGSGSVSEKADTEAPLPVLGLRGTYRLGDSNFYLNAHAQYFQLEYGNIEGKLLDVQAGVLWQFSRHVGVGVSYNLFDTSVDLEEPRLRGSLDWQYDGGQLFFRGSF